jgi:hypothetical protein
VGGVSGRPTRMPRGAILSSTSSSRRWKAPDLLDGGSLRGVPSERRSRPVRLVRRGLLLCGRMHRRQWVPPGQPRRGTSSACAIKAHALFTRGPQGLRHTEEDTSFARSRDLCSSIVIQPDGENRQLSRERAVIAVGQTRANGRNRHRGSLFFGRTRSSPRVTASLSVKGA